MISGMYLGDIVRRVILRMSQESDIFGTVPSRLSMPFILRFSPSLSLSLSLSHTHTHTHTHIDNGT
jgi:hexokinase